MPEQGRPPGSGERESIAVCLQILNLARGQLRTARQEATPRWNGDALRAELLTALERYAGAITQTGAPVPRNLRNEIELYRRLRNRA
jgi:hypothetical protein